MAWGSSLISRLRRDREQPIHEAALPGPAKLPERAGYEYGIPVGGLNEYRQGMGTATQTDRSSIMQELYEAYLSCPWAWASINAVARTITAGGLVTDWDQDDGEGDQETPQKPPEVLALERLLAYCNPSEDIRQLTRMVITDLLVFGDAFIEVSWVGNQPVALYNLDCPTMFPIADEHGQITKYVQVTEFGQRAEFEPREVIHIALDAPRSGVFGVSPTQAALLPITAWLFAASNGKEIFRKGQPPTVHVDFPAGMQQAEMNRWLQQYAARNIGPRNLGTPIATKGGATLVELAQGKTADLESFLDQKRDEILACYGVPPSKATVIESGNLGGGTGEAQDKTFRVNTCDPIAQLVLEKINFHVVRQGFGIQGWHLKFRDIDMRDSQTIETIRDTRLRNGSWTQNRYRAEIGEPPIAGGDDAVLVDRQNLVKWSDMDAMSKAGIAMKLKGTALEPSAPADGEPVTLEKPAPAPPAPFAGQPPPQVPPDVDPTSTEALHSAYRARLREALAVLPGGVDEYAA
ncbi:phage portal protein [Kitasatospora sp. NBC_01302]|uniref:phage portal protein n=1 Tax=Kitasatospora sp. NBC_01302 TaxID=2903575 RepID=UPI002E112444|nr:phage portal protein [Kitasatospora sp. NBC_01302]